MICAAQQNAAIQLIVQDYAAAMVAAMIVLVDWCCQVPIKTSNRPKTRLVVTE